MWQIINFKVQSPGGLSNVFTAVFYIVKAINLDIQNFVYIVITSRSDKLDGHKCLLFSDAINNLGWSFYYEHKLLTEAPTVDCFHPLCC